MTPRPAARAGMVTGLALLPFLALLALAGCSSVFDDHTQSVFVLTQDCPGAQCTLSNLAGTYRLEAAPGVVVVRKSVGDLRVTCAKDGASATSVHASRITEWNVGNIFLGGFPGMLIDTGSGAGYDYERRLINPLVCPK